MQNARTTQTVPTPEPDPNLPTADGGGGDARDPVPRLQDALTRLVGAVLVRPDADPALLDLPILQIKCLRLVADHEGQKLRELAARSELPPATVSRLIDRLVRAGLVARHTDPGDRRAVKLETTPRSREILARQRAARAAHLAACVRRLTPEELATVVAGLGLIAEAGEQVLADRHRTTQ
jgi:DNA-binding MarR family transcriptional regulator